ncbi:MAG: hypothetical protein WKG07_06565 [Hymenobacter sp.]
MLVGTFNKILHHPPLVAVALALLVRPKPKAKELLRRGCKQKG